MKTGWLRNFWKRLRPAQDAHKAKPAISAPEPDILKQMVRGIITTRSDEIGCTECFEQVDRFADMVLAGKDASEAMPLVQDHLERCGDCREEFEALLAALRAMV